MAFKLPNSAEVRLLVRQILRPRTKLGKTTLWFGGLALVLQVLKLISRSPAGSMLSGWASFIVFVFAACGCLMLLRWVRRHLMWRLRNRLIVTYVFIGVIPIVLLAAMALLAGYLFAGQFATYVAMSDLQSDLQHLDSANKALATQLRNLAKVGKLNELTAEETASASAGNFRRRTVTVWEDEKGFVIPRDRQTADNALVGVPGSITGDFAGTVIDGNRLHLRAVRRFEEGGRRLTVVSNVPITPELLRLATLTAGFGLAAASGRGSACRSGSDSQEQHYDLQNNRAAPDRRRPGTAAGQRLRHSIPLRNPVQYRRLADGQNPDGADDC